MAICASTATPSVPAFAGSRHDSASTSRSCPDIRVTLLHAAEEELGLAMREADVAIQQRQTRPQSFVQRKLFAVHFSRLRLYRVSQTLRHAAHLRGDLDQTSRARCSAARGRPVCSASRWLVEEIAHDSEGPRVSAPTSSTTLSLGVLRACQRDLNIAMLARLSELGKMSSWCSLRRSRGTGARRVFCLSSGRT